MNNTLIVYASRHGTTSEYAKMIFHLLNGNVDLCFLNERTNSLPNLSVYSTIVIGGSIHYGKNNKLVDKFVYDNLKLLKTKRLGLFITCYYEGDKALDQLWKAYPSVLLDQAIVSDYFDGELLFPKMSKWEKFITKLVLRSNEIRPILSKEKITQFVDKLQSDYEI